ncbi:DUF6795 domain-containing protein [Rubrivivax rivuli]|nr:DUF6795 domain-containing protein [Rubrivivax rivuli]
MDNAPITARNRTLRRLLGLAGLLLAGLGLTLATQGTAMAKMVMFSAVSGKVLQDGKPVAGAVVEREFRWSWKSETGTDATQTDAQGVFKLPLIERSSFMGSVLPHEPNVRQTILIKHGGKTYKAWMFDKPNYKPEGEIGRPIVMTCRLEKEPTHHGDVFGICELN